MKIGLVGYPGSGKSTVFGALTGRAVDTGFGAKENLGVVKVHDPRVDALAKLYAPKKTTYAEITFSDLPGGHADSLDRKALLAMKSVDALCQVLRAFPDAAGEPGDPLRGDLRARDRDDPRRPRGRGGTRVARVKKDRGNPRELALLERVQHGARGRDARAPPRAERTRSGACSPASSC